MNFYIFIYIFIYLTISSSVKSQAGNCTISSYIADSCDNGVYSFLNLKVIDKEFNIGNNSVIFGGDIEFTNESSISIDYTYGREIGYIFITEAASNSILYFMYTKVFIMNIYGIDLPPTSKFDFFYIPFTNFSTLSSNPYTKLNINNTKIGCIYDAPSVDNDSIGIKCSHGPLTPSGSVNISVTGSYLVKPSESKSFRVKLGAVMELAWFRISLRVYPINQYDFIMTIYVSSDLTIEVSAYEGLSKLTPKILQDTEEFSKYAKFEILSYNVTKPNTTQTPTLNGSVSNATFLQIKIQICFFITLLLLFLIV